MGEVREVRRGARVAALGRALEELGGLRLVFSCAGAAREGRGEVVERVRVVAARGEAQVRYGLRLVLSDCNRL